MSLNQGVRPDLMIRVVRVFEPTTLPVGELAHLIAQLLFPPSETGTDSKERRPSGSCPAAAINGGQPAGKLAFIAQPE